MAKKLPVRKPKRTAARPDKTRTQQRNRIPPRDSSTGQFIPRRRVKPA